jgi:23S rRNA (cytidine1920-2'-O)/16S rRNA (cytidine1409-2'-O)-methyltransferase
LKELKDLNAPKETKTRKKRLDVLVVERGLAESREKAHALIMAGLVLVDDQPATKAGTSVADSAILRLKAGGMPYVSRGGLKIEGAVANFGLEIEGKVCADVGCSTGGFTHYLLLNGAVRVYGIDVDVSQLDWRLQNDPRVLKVERNARFLEYSDIGEPVDLVTMDASFISLAMLLPRIPAILKAGGHCLALVKPQFEVGREKVGKGGIVRDEQDQTESVDKIIRAGEQIGLTLVGRCESAITGKEGNREFFVLFQASIQK